VHIDAVVHEVLFVHARVPRSALQFVAEPLEPLDVVLGVERKVDAAVPVEGDAVVGVGEVLAAEPEVDGVVGEDLEGHLGDRCPAQCGAFARICSASDLPSIWMPPSG
jgi:hypothetical protein